MADLEQMKIAMRTLLTDSQHIIEALRAENERLREALRPFAEAWDEREYLAEAHWSDFKKASAALGETK